jgi:hypothetical protein
MAKARLVAPQGNDNLDETACSQSDLFPSSDEHLKNRVLTDPSVTSITIGSRTFR